MLYDGGFNLFVGILSPEHVDSKMSTTTFDKTLDTLYERVKKTVLDGLRSLPEECLCVGYSGTFLGAQLDLTTADGDRCLQPLRRQLRQAEGTPEAGGRPPRSVRAHQTKQEVICDV